VKAGTKRKKRILLKKKVKVRGGGKKQIKDADKVGGARTKFKETRTAKRKETGPLRNQFPS